MSTRYILNWDGTDTYLAISDTTNKLVGLVPRSFVDASYDPRNLPAIVRKVRWQWRFDWDVMHYRLECNVKTGFKGNVRYKHYYSNILAKDVKRAGYAGKRY